MSFDTKTIDLAGGPVDLIADADIAAELAEAPPEIGIRIFVQNVGRGKVRFGERAAAPVRSTLGHCLTAGDGFVLRLRDGEPTGAWLWVLTTGTVAVSPSLEE